MVNDTADERQHGRQEGATSPLLFEELSISGAAFIQIEYTLAERDRLPRESNPLGPTVVQQHPFSIGTR